MKLLSIIGTRPQFIKLYPICRAVKNHNKNENEKIKHVIINTGQHFDRLMSDVFLEEMDIDYPDYNLNVIEKLNCCQIGRMIIALEKILLNEIPDIILVYGDTNSTLAGALAAKKMNLKLAHIEAGLRSFNRNMQEEINRIATDKISDILFCPTRNSFDNLREEGFFLKKNNYKIFNVGDVMYDAFLLFKETALSKSKILDKVYGSKKKNYILVTIHRAENTDNNSRLNDILKLLDKISEKRNIIFPIHPRTKNKTNSERLMKLNSDRIKIIEPVSYFDMLNLECNADFIITDSGGVQKEAYFFNKICITLRKETEWIETLKHGGNFLVDLDYNRIIEILNADYNYKFNPKLFGNGNSSGKIIKIIFDSI